jgi:ABC-type nitrate/sulfonate/bicarbonate transport system substrate-binding protein
VNTHAKVAIVLVALGVFGIAGYKFGWPYVQEQIDLQTSDARDIKAKLVVGVDNWIGYFPLCSGELRKRMRAKGYSLQCDDDKADYPKRMQRLKSGELQLAVATIDSYLLNGADPGFPGTIVAVIDESKGGDAIVAWKDTIATIEDLKKKPNVRIAFTPGSPSEHMIRATSVHFDVTGLRGRKDWRREANGSPDALEKLLSKQADVAVVWEPDVTRALSQPGVVKILGSEDVDKLIVDVLLVGRKFSQDNPDAVAALLREYFAVIRFYREDPARLEQDYVEVSKLPVDKAKASLKGVAWVSLSDNFQQWMGGGGGAEGWSTRSSRPRRSWWTTATSRPIPSRTRTPTASSTASSSRRPTCRPPPVPRPWRRTRRPRNRSGAPSSRSRPRHGGRCARSAP